MERPGEGSDRAAGGEGNDRLAGGSSNDLVDGDGGSDRVSGNRGNDVVQGGYGDDGLFGGWGSDRVYGGRGDDVLHALAPDGELDLLDCGPGRDTAIVLRSEVPHTRLVDCERVIVVDMLTADQADGELADADAEAE